MKNFRFPLQRTMDWRELRAEQEKSELERLNGIRDQLGHSRMHLQDELETLGREASDQKVVTAEQLHQMASFSRSLYNLDRRLKSEEDRCDDQIEQQRQKCIQADRDHRLLVHIHDESKRQWRYGVNRELDELATETWNSGRIREQNRTRR